MKNILWFRHDCNARYDPKLRRAVGTLGPQAGWCYWNIIEQLYEQEGKLPLDVVGDIAYESRVDVSIVESLIKDFDLFVLKKDFFYSERVLEELENKNKRSKSATNSAAIRWSKENSHKERNANAMRTQSESNANTEQYNTIKETKKSYYTVAEKNKEKSDCPNPSSSQSDDTLEPQKLNNDFKTESDALSTQDNKTLIPDIQPAENGTKSAKESKYPFHPEAVIDLWNDKINGTSIAKLVTLSEKRKDKVALRIREMERYGNWVGVMGSVFDKMARSKFLQGGGRTGWKATFDWLFTNDSNWLKVYEGQYDNSEDSKDKGIIRDRSGAIMNVNALWENRDMSAIFEDEE